MRRVLLAVLAVALVATAAWGGWTYLVPHTVALPNVVGAQLAVAQQRIGDLGLTVRLAEGRYSKRVAKGNVIRMSPGPGTDLEHGARVLLVPSLGPPPVPVPDLTGKTVEQARTLLVGADLKLGPVHKRYDDRYDVGRIVAQSDGAKAPWGSAIDVWVSKGPKPVPVPKVVGTTLDQADTALGAWVVTVNQKFSDTVPKDQVVAQHPAAGTELQPGQSVTIVVSLGPRTFPMPAVVGMSKDAAAARLQDLGLKVGFTPIPGSNADTVVSTLPTAGTTVRYGQVVTLFVA
jgi:serine/threonine-protein kinase